MSTLLRDPQAIAAGLRHLADFIDAHPDLEPPFVSTMYVFLDGSEEEPAARKLAEYGQALGSFEKRSDGQFFKLARHFGPFELQVCVERELVCRRVVVGTETVTREVPPEGVTMTTVVEEVEVVEWVCPPSILALAGADAERAAS
jgi:hypothetical protein